MKRWRCPDCRAVHTHRPRSHWRRFLASWWIIVLSVLQRLEQGRRLSMVGRQRQQYWVRGYRKQRQIAGGLAGVWELHEAGIIVASHSLTDCVREAAAYPTHRRFAATDPPPAR